MVRRGSGPVYVFDASAWIDCNERAGDNRIPPLLARLYGTRRICSPKQVFKELEKPGEISEWVEERRATLLEPRGWPPEFTANVGRVQFEFPAMGRATGTKRRADPFVVAAALTYYTEQRPWIVVAGESRKGRAARKIPSVCDHYGIECITLEELIARELPYEDRYSDDDFLPI
jgi:hypothetical protein